MTRNHDKLVAQTERRRNVARAHGEDALKVQVLDGFQRFREYPDGKKELPEVPFAPVNTVVNPGGEWSELTQMAGTALPHKIHQSTDRVVNRPNLRTKVYWCRGQFTN